MRHIPCLAKIFVVALLWATGTIVQEAVYMKERPTKRIALVVGNTFYNNAERIDS